MNLGIKPLTGRFGRWTSRTFCRHGSPAPLNDRVLIDLFAGKAAILPPIGEVATLRPLPSNPCTAHPCGPNSRCRVVAGAAECSCLPGMIGFTPACRPQCIAATDCPASQACVNQRCVDPCPGTCAVSADCRVIDHSPVCVCRPGFTGDAYSNCRPIPVIGTVFETALFESRPAAF